MTAQELSAANFSRQMRKRKTSSCRIASRACPGPHGISIIRKHGKPVAGNCEKTFELFAKEQNGGVKAVPLLLLCYVISAVAAEKPNIVFILADDLGYGDVRCFNPNGKIATPNWDRLAAEGMMFTDAHTSA